MATITPHRDATEDCLRAMREGVAIAKAKDPSKALAFDLTIGLAEAAMRPIGDARDVRTPTREIADALVMALANLLNSLSQTLGEDDPEHAKMILGYISHNSKVGAFAVMDNPPDSNSVTVQYSDDVAGRA